MAKPDIIPKHILFCHCGGQRISPGLLRAVDIHLEKLPVHVTRFSDLCGVLVEKRELVRDLFTANTEYLVIGCSLRTMNLLFDQTREDSDTPVTFSHINMIDLSPDEVFDKINAFCSNYKSNAVYTEIAADPGWPSWYPIIDYRRCTACGQCAEFCLFGVYQITEGNVRVVNPQECKNNCPACARICPSTAIVFPKYVDGGAIGGSDDIDEDAEHQRQVKDIEKCLGDDIFSALERRRGLRQSIIREEAMKKAISERNDALSAKNET